MKRRKSIILRYLKEFLINYLSTEGIVLNNTCFWNVADVIEDHLKIIPESKHRKDENSFKRITNAYEIITGRKVPAYDDCVGFLQINKKERQKTKHDFTESMNVKIEEF